MEEMRWKSKKTLLAPIVAWLLYQSNLNVRTRDGKYPLEFYQKSKLLFFFNFRNAASSPLNRDLRMLLVYSHCSLTDLEHFSKMNEVKLSSPDV